MMKIKILLLSLLIGICFFNYNVAAEDIKDEGTINLSKEDVFVKYQKEWEYTGTSITPTVSVILGELTLVEDRDYTVKYAYNTVASINNPTIYITGIGNYSGEIERKFVILRKNLSDAIVTARDYSYTGVAIKITPTVTLNGKYLSNDDFAVSGYSSNVNPGTATVYIVGKGNYEGVASGTFIINKPSGDYINEVTLTTSSKSISGYVGNVKCYLDDDYWMEYTVSGPISDSGKSSSSRLCKSISFSAKYAGTYTITYSLYKYTESKGSLTQIRDSNGNWSYQYVSTYRRGLKVGTYSTNIIISSLSYSTISASSIRINKSTINSKDKLYLGVESVPSGADISERVWLSSDSSVATVDNKGVVTVHKPGSANISVKVGDLEGTGKVESEAISLDKCVIINNNYNNGVGFYYANDMLSENDYEIEDEVICGKTLIVTYKGKGIFAGNVICCFDVLTGVYRGDEVYANASVHDVVVDGYVEATCDNDGLSEGYHCSVCSKIIKDQNIISKKGHTYDSGKVTKEPTDLEEGEKTYTCINCGASKTEKIEKTEHIYDNGKVTKESTEIEEGEKTYTCINCGATRTEKIEKKKPHVWGKGFIISEATPDKEGSRGYYCYECSEKKTEVIPRLWYDLQWYTVGDKAYWYEDGVRQGTNLDKLSFTFEGTIRGREIFDKASSGWYWLDACYDGAKAVNKEVFMPYIYNNEIQMTNDEVKNIAKLSVLNRGDVFEDGTVIPYTYDMSKQVEKAIMAHKANPDSRDGGKWVRYDANGNMIKGWYTVGSTESSIYPNQKGCRYFYDYKTGLMAKGDVVINGIKYHFDETTGALIY